MEMKRKRVMKGQEASTTVTTEGQITETNMKMKMETWGFGRCIMQITKASWNV